MTCLLSGNPSEFIGLHHHGGPGEVGPARAWMVIPRAPSSPDREADMTVTTRGAPSQQAQPVLALCALSDSFAALWPRLAAEVGLALEVFGRDTAPPRQTDQQVVLLAVGGAEGLTEEAVQWLRAAAISPVQAP